MAKILLAEDDDMLRVMTKTILEIGGHEVFAYPNGQQALDDYESVLPDLLVSDISMPILDGFGLLDGIRSLASGKAVPFLFLSARSEHDDVRQARNLGADDYLFKPYDADELIEAVQVRLDRRKAIALFDTRQAHLETITMLANVIEARDAYTRGHVERVQSLALQLGRALDWSDQTMVILEYGALLHDVGKIVVPEAVLNKPGKLTPEEMDVIRRHTTDGAKILDGITHLRGAIPYVLYHHEKWDGTGYPTGLSEDRIPREGRMMAIVDVFDALTSDRPYHKGMPVEKVREIIRNDAGTHFDPQMVQVFLRLELPGMEKS